MNGVTFTISRGPIESAASRMQTVEVWDPAAPLTPAPRSKRTSGPKTNYAQLRIEGKKLAGLPPGLKVAEKAEALGVTKRTLERYLSGNKD
jgi:hypothetical protein